MHLLQNHTYCRLSEEFTFTFYIVFITIIVDKYLFVIIEGNHHFMRPQLLLVLKLRNYTVYFFALQIYKKIYNYSAEYLF